MFGLLWNDYGSGWSRKYNEEFLGCGFAKPAKVVMFRLRGRCLLGCESLE